MSKRYSLDYIIRKDKMNDKGECPIILRYTFNRNYLRIPLGFGIGVDDWDNENRIPKSTYRGMRSVLSAMIDLSRKIELIIEKELTKYNIPPSKEKLKILLGGVNVNHKSSDSLLLSPLIRSFIDKKKEDPQVRLATLSVYETTFQKWIEYENSTRKYKVNEFYFEDLERFQIKLKNDGLMFSTVGKYVKTMKTFLNYMSTNLNIPMDQTFKKVKVEREEENNFEVLSDYELEQIRKSISYTRYEIGEDRIVLNDRERLIGRMFWFMCMTGMNYVDMLNLTIHDIVFDTKELQKKGSQEKPEIFVFFSFNRQKATKPIPCIIPLHGHIIEMLLALINPYRFGVLTMGDTRINPNALNGIFEKAVLLARKDTTRLMNKNFRIFPYVPNSSFNLEIKDLCEKLGFDDTKKIKLKKKGNPEIIKRKFEFITARTGRRTYITNCLKKGVRPDILMKTTGHLKMDTMKRYNKYTNQSINEEFMSKMYKNE